MKKYLLIVFILFTTVTFGQTRKTISIYDFIKIKDGKMKEALYYYEMNWKFYREIAIKRNFILSYKIVSAVPDSISNFDLILITEYADSLSHARSEVNFSEIIKESRPNGPLLLNDLKPQDFRINLFYRNMETVVSSSE